ncbi:neuronal membrane glycoprotein M6-a [Acyrthosiphon pisum]|uniref:Neuronal membrane glycoprotein M6-b n=2 Tax=Macrosiphini TaxID=33386 RepID=A0A8R1W7P2_ACYPI|nr:neuronal membrane glycoprotein M6-a [Acyrthosiphon pisum]XP_060858879.1 neuronal membrane glycoprotein M6-a-like isoform X2 [Metopolophium dirhodum]|eukprot:XP_001952193.2 PREDICTED: neuronal membrane glycoprotein M6-a [Acyrthosiphon pisum]
MNKYSFQRPEMEMPLQSSHYNPSRETLGRYSEYSLHSSYKIRAGDAASTNSVACTTRIPYATLIAALLCCTGIGVFCCTMYRGVTLSALMLDQVFHLYIGWLETVKTVLVLIAAGMGALTLMIIFVGFLATGATRRRIYKAWRNRVGGRISCAVFMGIIYVLQFFWIFVFGLLIVSTFILTVFWKMCVSTQVQDYHQCIDLTQFNFLFPQSTRIEYLKICEIREIKFFCRDFVEKSEFMFMMATFGVILILISLVHYLMCLSANYAHIRDHEKFEELQELQLLQDTDFATSKERF